MHEFLQMEDISEGFLEQREFRLIKYPVVLDTNGHRVVYHAAFSDFFHLLNHLSSILSFFIESELIPRTEDKFNIFDTDEKISREKAFEDITDQNFDYRISELSR